MFLISASNFWGSYRPPELTNAEESEELRKHHQSINLLLVVQQPLQVVV